MGKCGICEEDAEKTCSWCGREVCKEHAIEIGDIVICTDDLKKKLIPILAIMVTVIIIIVLGLIFWV
jgi:uncharacterized membrane protein YvbJ